MKLSFNDLDSTTISFSLSLSLSLSLMATTIHLCFLQPFLIPTLSPCQTQRKLSFAYNRNQNGFKPCAVGGDLVGDFGGRDPFPAEIESGFAEKVLGNVDTEHRILIPNISALSLAQQHCSPLSPLQPPMSIEDAQKLLRKVVGWRLLDEEGGLKLQCLWKLRDFKSGVELINRIYLVAEAAGHFPNLHLEHSNQVRAELWSSSIGGLSMNDFIVAAKIDEIRTSDLVPRKRMWA